MEISENRSYQADRSDRRRQATGLIRTGVILSLLIVSTLPEIKADSLRCGRKVVRTGDTPEHLLNRCGEPLRHDYATEEFWLEGGLQKVRVERWFYKPGKRKLGLIVLIYRGKIVAVRTGDR